MMQYGLTLTPFLERAGKFFPGVEVISRLPDNSVRRSTYSDLHRRARALAASLQHAGLRQGDRVATLMWNHSDAPGGVLRDPCGRWRGTHAQPPLASG